MLYVLSKENLVIKDIIQVSDYSIEENISMNGQSTFVMTKLPNAVKDDYVQFDNFKGIIYNIETNKESDVYTVYVNDMNSLFDRNIILTEEALIASTGVEDFIAEIIHDRWTNSSDTLLNIGYLDVTVSTHTPLNITIETMDGVYNFKSFLALVKLNYGIELDYTFDGSYLEIVIGKKEPETFNVDLTISDIVLYDEVYSVDVIAKVTVFSKETSTEFDYFLKTDKTITTNQSDPDRAFGKIETVVCETDVEVEQKAIDTFKANSYDHNISFSLIADSLLYEKQELYVNRPLKVKTFDNGIYETYISKVKNKMKMNIIEYECGNIKINLIDKLKGTLW